MTVNKEGLIISPNPAKDYTQITVINYLERATIWVYDITGKAVIKLSIENLQSNFILNTQQLANGIYLLKVDLAKESFAKQLIISK